MSDPLTYIISALAIVVSAHSVLFSSATRWYTAETARAWAREAPRPKPWWLRYAEFWLHIGDSRKGER